MYTIIRDITIKDTAVKDMTDDSEVASEEIKHGDNKFIKMCRKRYRCSKVESVVKRRCIDDNDKVSRAKLRQIELYIGTTLGQEIQVPFSKKSSSIFYAIHFLIRCENLKALNVYFFNKTHERALRLCAWDRYIVIMDVLDQYTKPGNLGYQILASQNILSEEIAKKILAIDEIMTSDWQWGLSELCPSKMVPPKFLLTFGIEDWYTKRF